MILGNVFTGTSTPTRVVPSTSAGGDQPPTICRPDAKSSAHIDSVASGVETVVVHGGNTGPSTPGEGSGPFRSVGSPDGRFTTTV